MPRTAAPLYVLIVTKPEPARMRRASRTGVFDTPSRAPTSPSTSVSPGPNSPLKIESLIASRTKSVRETGGGGLRAEEVLATGMSDLIYDATYNIITDPGSSHAASHRLPIPPGAPGGRPRRRTGGLWRARWRRRPGGGSEAVPAKPSKPVALNILDIAG